MFDRILAADFGRVLVATDGSDGARAATERAVKLADAVGGKLHVVHVTERADEDRTETHDLSDPDETAGVDALGKALELAREAGLETVESSVLGGRPD